MSYRKVGGLRFIKLGRFNFSWSLSRKGRKVAPKAPKPSPFKGLTLEAERVWTDAGRSYVVAQ